MSLVIARKKRTALYFAICGLLATVAAVSAVSARDPSGVSLRVGMIMMTVGAAMWLPWRALIPTILAIWLGPNYIRCLIENETLFGVNMFLELPGLLGLGFFSGMARQSLRNLEDEDLLLGAASEEVAGLDPETGVLEERLLVPALETELVRSRRFNREFALVLVGIDPMRQRFDYRDEEAWRSSFHATAQLLRSTRAHVDRAYRYGESSFALILPESGEKEVTGMIRRLRRVSRQATPSEGEPGGPMPTHFGATFFPQCATTPDDLLRRAEVTLRIAERNSNRVQLDGAEAPDMPPPETLRKPELETPLVLATTAAAIEEMQPEVAEPVEMPAMAPVPLFAVEEKEPVAAESAWPSAAQILASLPAPAPYLEVIEPVSESEYVEGPVLTPMVAHVEPEAPVAPALTLVAETQPEAEPVASNVIEMPAGVPVVALRNMEPQPLDADVADILKHLDETLDLIRSLRTSAS